MHSCQFKLWYEKAFSAHHSPSLWEQILQNAYSFFMSCFVKAYPEDSITDHVFMSKLASTYLSMNKLAVVFMVLLCANNAKNRLLIYSCLASTCVHCLSFVTTINLSFFLSHIYFLKHILIVNKMYYCWFIISKGFFANKYDGNTGCSLNIVFFP